MDMSIFGHNVTDEKMHSVALHRNGVSGVYSNIIDTLGMIKVILCIILIELSLN